ncbi:MAG: hypothetical protein U5R31_01530 [Acidimicrobiia bacterium]|nr:hypothetical protein [Acidimicrobiia bacterium]
MPGEGSWARRWAWCSVARSLQWLIEVLIPQTVPDIAIGVTVDPATYLTAGVLDVVAVAAAPVLTVRRLRRMDVPATLRVVE